MSYFYLQHKRDCKTITCGIDYQAVLRVYYRQWRDEDGTIPWTIEYHEGE